VGSNPTLSAKTSKFEHGTVGSPSGLPLLLSKNACQEAFADVLGVHRTYMGGVERGDRNLTLKSVERLAAKLDVEPLGLLTPAEA
jgi:transcriptional regulator with XRE-family HTH domain